MSDFGETGWWRASGRLAAAAIGGAAIAALFFLSLVEAPDAEGYPLGLVVAASGLPVSLALIVFRFARGQERLDHRHGLYED